MCVHLYEIVAFYIFNIMVGSEELSRPFDSMMCYVYFLSCNYMVFEWRCALENQRIHDHQLAIHEEELDEQLDMQMNIAPAA